MEGMTTFNWGEEEIPSLRLVSTWWVTSFRRTGKHFLFPEGFRNWENTWVPRLNHARGSKLGQKNLQPIHSMLLPPLGSMWPWYLQFQSQCQLKSVVYFSLHTTKLLRQRRFIFMAHLPSNLEWAMTLIFFCSSPPVFLIPEPNLLSHLN